MSWVTKNTRIALLEKETAPITGKPKYIKINSQSIIQVKLEGTSGPISATVELYGSLDPISETSQTNAAKILLATFTLSGTGAGADVSAATDAWGVAAQYSYFWAKIISMAGTGAAVSAWGSI